VLIRAVLLLTMVAMKKDAWMEGNDVESFVYFVRYSALTTLSQSSVLVSPSLGLKSVIVSLPGPQSK